jgi:hypothetical protein
LNGSDHHELLAWFKISLHGVDEVLGVNANVDKYIQRIDRRNINRDYGNKQVSAFLYGSRMGDNIHIPKQL